MRTIEIAGYECVDVTGNQESALAGRRELANDSDKMPERA